MNNNSENAPEKRKRGRPRKPDSEKKFVRSAEQQKYRDLADAVKASDPNVVMYTEQETELTNKTGKYLPQNVNAGKGDNTRYLKNALAAWDLPRVDTKDDKAVEDRIKMYFDYCAENDIKPQVIGMAQWLGVTRDTLARWRRGEVGNHQATLSKAYLVMESLWADYMQNGKINPVSGIFLAKSWFGYKDQTEYVVTPGRAEEVSNDDLIAEARLLNSNEQNLIEGNIIDQ